MAFQMSFQNVHVFTANRNGTTSVVNLSWEFKKKGG